MFDECLEVVAMVRWTTFTAWEWQQEAALRRLTNDLAPEVAKWPAGTITLTPGLSGVGGPQPLVVVTMRGGSG